ncbi:MAG: anthranilate phosphoribosyltransferase [Pseudomonadales bacterium]|nr:anthranilate phosphoribosyltransferase [Pseudomonadales bacterium]
MPIHLALQTLLEKNDLDAELMTAAMKQIMTGQATPAQIGGFLVALRMKGETVTEITAAAKVMRELATPVNIDLPNLVDTCGTGGDSSGVFNVSTASAFVVAAAGGKVAKHGNRSISSKSGSADLLEAAGVNLDLTPEQVARCVRELGVGFMFAVKHHGAMKHAIGPRRELGVRTIFNVLGPLTNPAGAPNQVMGVFSKTLLRPIAEVLSNLGSQHVLVVHSHDGMDEISLCAPTDVVELNKGKITEYTLQPEDFGFERCPLNALQVDSVEASLAKVEEALTNSHSKAADMVALNAGAAIFAANIASSLAEGVAMAQDIIGTKLAWAKLKDLAALTQQCHDID